MMGHEENRQNIAEQPDYLRNVRLLEAIAIMRSSLFIIPVLLLYYEQRVGIGFRELLIGEAVFAATLLFFDLPAGYLSDRWQRRKVLIVSQLFALCGLLTLALATSFAAVILAQFLLGIAFALSSNTDSSLLYDSLLSANKQHEFSRFEGRRNACSFYSIAFSSVVGGFLFNWDILMPNNASLLIYCAGLVCAFLLIEPPKHEMERHRNPFIDAVQAIYTILRDNAAILLMILFSGLLFSGTKLMMWSQQAYYIELGLDPEWFGILMACGFIFAGFSAHLAHLLGRVLAPLQVMVLGLIIVVTASLVAAFSVSWLGVLALMFGGTCVYGMVNPHFVSAVNHRLESGRRATILSVAGTLRNLLFMFLSVTVGEIIGLYDLQTGFFAMFGWFMVAGAIFATWRLLSLWRRTVRLRRNG